jgi:hypothetical protein
MLKKNANSMYYILFIRGDVEEKLKNIKQWVVQPLILIYRNYFNPNL